MAIADATLQVLTADGVPLKTKLRRATRMSRIRAFLLATPLLLFITVSFIVPIVDMLYRSVDNPRLLWLFPETMAALEQWDGEKLPGEATFAALAIPELGKNGKLLRNTHRSAGFRVLKAPDMPSVLIELGYLSNPKDEEQLLSSSGRRKLMDGLVQAIERYFDKRSCWS